MHFGSVDRLEGSIASSELAQRVITEMVQKNSLDEPYICHTVEHAKEIEILEQLKTHRLVETDSTLSSKTAGLVGDQSRWVLAAGAFSQLRIVQALFVQTKQNKTNTKQHQTKIGLGRWDAVLRCSPGHGTDSGIDISAGNDAASRGLGMLRTGKPSTEAAEWSAGYRRRQAC